MDARRRFVPRRRALVLGVQAAAVSEPGALVRRPRRILLRARPVLRRRPQAVGVATSGFPQPPGVGQTFVRHIRAMVRQREARRRRQLWRPRPEEVIPPIAFEPVFQTSKGRISWPGVTRGVIKAAP